jgi:hypothetical protein
VRDRHGAALAPHRDPRTAVPHVEVARLAGALLARRLVHALVRVAERTRQGIQRGPGLAAKAAGGARDGDDARRVRHEHAREAAVGLEAPRRRDRRRT